MFRRTKTAETTATAPDAAHSPGTTAKGKGRPTPSRKEAEAARRARARGPRTRKELRAAQRKARMEASQRTREAMKRGDERYYMPRDRGPVKRFIRDYIDSRFSFAELSMPLVLVIWILGITGVPSLVSVSSTLMLALLLAIIIDLVLLRLRLRNQLRNRFPEEPLKGTTFYAITRALQMRFLRLPKPQVKVGARLPERYR